MSDLKKYLQGLRSYLLVGIIATGVDWVLFAIFVFVMDLHYLASAVLSFLIATLAGYFAGLQLMFRGGRHKRWLEVALVYLASILGFLIHMGIMLVCVDWLTVPVFMAKVVATAATYLWNFTIRHFWIFDRSTSNA